MCSLTIECVLLLGDLSTVRRLQQLGPWNQGYPSICLSIYLSVCLSVYLSIYLSIYLSVYLSVYLSIYLSVWV